MPPTCHLTQDLLIGSFTSHQWSPALYLICQPCARSWARSGAFVLIGVTTASREKRHEVRQSRNSAVCCEKGSGGWGATAGVVSPTGGHRRVPQGNDIEAKNRGEWELVILLSSSLGLDEGLS